MSTDKECIPESIHNNSSLITHNRDKFPEINCSSMENNKNCLIKTEHQNLDDYSIFIKEEHKDLHQHQIYYSNGTSDQFKYEEENDGMNIKIEKSIIDDNIYFSEIVEKNEEFFQNERDDNPSFESNVGSIFPLSSLCNKPTVNEETNQHQIDRLKKQCYYCQQLFDRKKNLISHIKLHCQFKMCSFDKIEENSYICDVCQMLFPHLKNLRNHKKIHIKDKLFRCNLCYKTFTDQSNYGRHQKTHSGENNFTCHICKKSFNRKSNLNTHIKIIHKGEKPFKCEICQEMFPRKYNLTRHYIHHCDKIKSKAQLINTSKKHLCKVCQKSFYDERSLRRHEWTHLKNKPFQCDNCKLSFHRKDTLVVHIRSYHTKERLFKCDICDKSFVEKNVLDRHKNTHKISIVMSTKIK